MHCAIARDSLNSHSLNLKGNAKITKRRAAAIGDALTDSDAQLRKLARRVSLGRTV